MRTTIKGVLAAGAVVASLAAGPLANEAEAEPVVSSWYGSELEGAPTASGEPYRPEGHTAAHPSLPLGTELLVTYGGRQDIVRVTDRGPHVKGRGLDLSQAAAEDIGLTTTGADAVDVKVLDGSGGDIPPEEQTPREGYASPEVSQAVPQEYTPRKEYASQEQYTPRERRVSREYRDGMTAYLLERPYLRVLGAAAPYSSPSTRACHEASMMFAPTPTAPQTRLPSVESMSTRVVAAVARCSSSIRTL